MHTAEPFEPEPSAAEVEVAVGKLERYKSPGIDQIPAELIQTGGEKLCLEICKLIKLIWNKELPYQWKESIVVPVHKKGDRTAVVIIEAYHCCQFHTKFYQTFFSEG
jgi:hypothetical protein